MNNNIINFDRERRWRRETNTATDIILQQARFDAYVSLQCDFSVAYQDLMSSFKTKKSKFMFPTILSSYRKGIDPVNAIYYSLQKVLLNYDSSDDEHRWIIGLFEDTDWVNSLLHAVQEDRDNISAFRSNYGSSAIASTYIKSILEQLKVRENELDVYAEVFIYVYTTNIE